MMPKQHATMSLAVGLLGWLWSGDPAALPLALASGTLLDIDHVADYAWYFRTREHRLILPLHGYEWAFILWCVVERRLGRRAAIAAVVSYLLHLWSDQRGNRTGRGANWLVWRAILGFRLDRLSRAPQAATQGREEDLRAIAHLLRRIRSRLHSDTTARA